MKKLLLLVTLICVTGFCYAQEQLPTVVPVSPEAASLGKYGDLPVNLASGRINYSIPIFTVNENGLQLPIYLSYNHSGLMAEEDPGLVGLGWTLHAGGMVVRQLRGKPDEKSLGYVAGDIGKDLVIPFNYAQWDNLPSSEREAKVLNLFDGAETGRLDTKPDKFVINAGNLSGNFSYNELGEAMFYPHKNYKVIQDSNGFEITGDNGIIYTFGEEENTYTEPVVSSAEALANNPPMDYVSGWGLTKIASPISNGEINLEYNLGASYYKEGVSESRSMLLTSTGNSGRCAINPNQINKSWVETEIFKKQISKITFTNGSVEFDIRIVPNGSLSRSKNYLHGITVKNSNGDVISSYEFVYDNLLSNFKLLKEVKKFGTDNTQIPFFKLEYNGTPPTEIDYTSQDSWGYYNGKTNTNLINADRTVNFAKSSLGALTKIAYPTKGYTEINYESNTVPLLEGGFIGSGQCYTTPINKTESLIANSSSNSFPSNKTILIKTDQVIKVQVASYTYDNGFAEAMASIVKTSGPDDSFECNVYDSCNNSGQCISNVTSSREGGGNIVMPNYNKTSYFSVKANTVLTLSASAEAYNQASANSKVIVDYFDPDLITPETNYVEVGGIRVASTVDCSTSDDCISKNYKYKQEDGVTSGKILYRPTYKYMYEIDDAYGPSCQIETTSASSRIPLASFQGAPVLYDRVEILRNDDQTKGKTVQYFSYHTNSSPAFPFAPINNKDWKKGNLLKEEVYQYKENHLSLVRTTENNYNTYYPFATGLTQRKHSMGLASGRIEYVYTTVSNPDPNSNGGSQNGLHQGSQYFIERSYNNRPEFYHLESSTSTMDGITTTTDYVYDTTTGYLKETLTTDSNGDELTQKNYFPTDLGNSTLITQNRIAAPIKTESYIKKTGSNTDVKLATQNTVFAIKSGNYLPSVVQLSTGTNSLEDRIVYEDYYDNGNIKEVSKKDGTHIVYIWGYNQTSPIAKVENATFGDIPTPVYNDLISKSNTDMQQGTVFSENALRTSLETLRNHANLSNAMVTTFTYDPLIGVTSITDPRGETIFYEYDAFNRLKQVKDAYGKIVTANEYHFKN